MVFKWRRIIRRSQHLVRMVWTVVMQNVMAYAIFSHCSLWYLLKLHKPKDSTFFQLILLVSDFRILLLITVFENQWVVFPSGCASWKFILNKLLLLPKMDLICNATMIFCRLFPGFPTFSPEVLLFIQCCCIFYNE